MPAIDVTDMRDLVPDPLVQLTPQMAKRRAFLGGIVRAATATPLAKSVSGIPCRRRPGNRPCLGSIAVRRTDLPERSIFWECTACGDAGRIAGFQDGPDDLSAAAELSLGHTGKRRTVVVTAQEYSSWISGDLIAYDIESMQILYSAIASSRGIRISALQDELGALLDATSADANHEPNRKRRAHLDSICDKLAGVRRMPKKRRSRSITAAEPAYAHGFFSALVAGPLVTPSRWLERFITEEPESIEEFSAHAERIMNTCNEVAEALLQRRERFGDETLAIAGMGAHGDALIDWHQGFLDAMDLSPDEWTDFLATQPKELFGPLALIAQCAADPSKRSWLHERDVRENTAFALGIMTARLWEAYRDQPFVRLESAHETVRRADPKVSRNAPCPCGSGKKYKLCCGSTLRSV